MRYKERLNISTNDNSLDLNLVTEVAPFFRLKNVQAVTIIQKTVSAVSKWKQLATKYKLSRDEQDRMNPAFRT